MRARGAVPKVVHSADDLASHVRARRRTLKLSRQSIADVTGIEARTVSLIERGRAAPLELRVILLVVSALAMDVELRGRDEEFVPVPPSLVSELGLSPAALAALDAAGIQEVAQLPSASDLLGRGMSGEEVYEVVCALARHRRSLGRSVPGEREREMLWLRAVEGLTLKQIGERFAEIAERVRQLLVVYFGLHSPPPAAKGRSSRGRRD
jgi:transcriptional regulator with XRE-family HTH domain